MDITVQPIGFVTSGRVEAIDDAWDGEASEITLTERFDAASFHGLEAFSHVEVVYQFHLVSEDAVVLGTRHPRERLDWPPVGIFAQRGRVRPNRLAVSVCRLVDVVVDLERPKLAVVGLDAIVGSPVLDIKPVMSGFMPRGEIRQPTWATEIMADYW
ncbi:MAG: TrmO family methyltransferase [Ilumatobacteraceae bacterium]